MTGGGSGLQNKLKSSSDIHEASSPAIQEVDEEVAMRNNNPTDHDTIEHGSPRAGGSNTKRKKKKRRTSNRKSQSRSPPPFDLSVNPKNITIGDPGKSLIDPNLKLRL